MDLKAKTKLFFDLDSTLTPSRQSIKEPMARLLPRLGRTIVVVSGSKNSQIKEQVGDLSFFSLGQNGNQGLNENHEPLWENLLTADEKSAVYAHIHILQPKLTHTVPNESDLVEDRGSQISFSIYGHHAPAAEKKACDGDFAKRKDLLSRYPFLSDTMEVQMGGTTCLDYFKKGCHKGSNVKKLIEMMGWKAEECVYFGDALFPGGNDDSVNGVIDTVPVTDEEDTYRKLKALLA